MRGMNGFAVAVLGLALLAPTGAEQEWTATDGGWVSGPVEYVDTLEEDAGGGSSAVLHRHRLYVTTFKSFSIYDVRDALNPKHLSTTPLGVHAFNEQPETNGKFLLLSNDMKKIDAGVDPPRLAGVGSLEVWDVRDPRNPQHLASLEMPKREHQWTCVFDCDYAYGAGGAIVDLSHPEDPRIVGDWTDDLETPPTASQIHAIDEVAPGLVLTGGIDSYLVDGREDPADPTIIATVPGDRSAVAAHVAWPHAPDGRWALVSTETPLGGDCNEGSGGLLTYDTTGWRDSGTFRPVDEYRFSESFAARPRTYTDGRSAHHVFGCSAYSFGVPEHFAETGLVAVAWFEDGMRLLRVADDGTLTEVGGFLPLGGSSTKPVWRNDEVVYLVDTYRGVDILRVDVGD